jgi:PAS domain S-box-containing protein
MIELGNTLDDHDAPAPVTALSNARAARAQAAARAVAAFERISATGARLRRESERLAAESAELRRQREAMRLQRERLREHGTALRQTGVPSSRGGDERLLFEDAPSCYLVTDAQGAIRRANRRAALVLDRPREELEGRPLAALVHRDDRADFQVALARLLGSREVEEWPLRLLPRRGRAVELRIEACALRDRHERVTAIHWILHPVEAGLAGLL